MVEMAARRAPVVEETGWLKVMPPATRLAFQGGAAARSAALEMWGVEFASDACRAHARSGRATLWLGPDEYLLLDVSADTKTVSDALETAMAGTPHCLVDISHRQFALELSGPHATTILNGGCPLDLDIGEFPVDMCTRTVFAKAEIVLWRTGPETFHVEVWRSFAGYVTGLLAEIASEFYPAA